MRFDLGTPLSSTAEESWRRTASLVRRVALANAASPDGHLLADELGRLLCTIALTSFPNSTMRTAAVAPARTTPASLRKAVAFIDANLDRPVTLDDIATAAGVSSRALNLTFRRHLDTTPTAYLRRARLDCAHRDLQAAPPGDGQTVTSIAARWGFYSLPRFGVAYREAYGRPPSQTLRDG